MRAESIVDILRPLTDDTYRPGYRLVTFNEGVKYYLVYSSDTVYREDR